MFPQISDELPSSSQNSSNKELSSENGVKTETEDEEMEFNETSEIEAAEKVINAMYYYQKYCLVKLKRQADAIKNLSEEDRCLLISPSTEHLRKVRDCVQENQKLFEVIVQCGANMLGGSVKKALEKHKLHTSNDHYMTKAKSILKQIVRDWSSEGITERESCYRLILDEMQRLFPVPQCDRPSVHVLVTGAGLARLAWEFSKMGFSVTGNEFSYFMLLTSNFILNACQQEEEFTIYPYLMDFSNSWCYEDQLRAVRFPDVDPTTAFSGAQRPNTFSMCAGDFMQAYANSRDKFDCVVSVFFIDTSPNPLEYIRLVKRVLKPGGIWLNFGPLTYHHEDSEEVLSLELPFETIVHLVSQCGFELDKVFGKNSLPPSKYTWNRDSMLQYNYHCGYFLARKIA